jgi:hypothetical protein
MEQETKHVSTNLVVVKIRSSPSFNRDSGANRQVPLSIERLLPKQGTDRPQIKLQRLQ